MNEHAVMAIVEGFKEKYLKDQQLLGFVVVDEDLGIVVASTFDSQYGRNLTNPIKSWVVYNHQVLGLRAFVMDNEGDFRSFVLRQNLQITA